MAGMQEMRKLDPSAKKVPQKQWLEQWFATATNSSALRRILYRTCRLRRVPVPRNHVSQDLAQNAILFALKHTPNAKTQTYVINTCQKYIERQLLEQWCVIAKSRTAFLKKSSKSIEKYRKIDTSGCANPGCARLSSKTLHFLL